MTTCATDSWDLQKCHYPIWYNFWNLEWVFHQNEVRGYCNYSINTNVNFGCHSFKSPEFCLLRTFFLLYLILDKTKTNIEGLRQGINNWISLESLGDTYFTALKLSVKNHKDFWRQIFLEALIKTSLLKIRAKFSFLAILKI